MESKFKEELKKLHDEFEGIPTEELEKAMENRTEAWVLYVFVFNIDLKTNVYRKRPEWYIFATEEELKAALRTLHAITKLSYDKAELYRTDVIGNGRNALISIAETRTQRSEKLYEVEKLMRVS